MPQLLLILAAAAAALGGAAPALVQPPADGPPDTLVWQGYPGPGVEERSPRDRDRQPGVVCRHASEGGIPYFWSLPPGYEPGRAVDLVLVCESEWLDDAPGALHRTLGERYIAVSITGLGTRGVEPYAPDHARVLELRELVLGLTRQLPADRIILVGEGEGGAFALHFAAYFPALADGIVAVGAPNWPESPTSGGIRDRPIAFLHGTLDAEVPFSEAIDAAARYRGDEHRMARVRRLPGFHHFTNPDRVAECLEWCRGMASLRPAEVLEVARGLAPAAPPDAMGYQTGPPLGMVLDLLDRFENTGPRPFSGTDWIEPVEVDPETAAAVAALRKEIDDRAALHAGVLRELLPASDALVLDGSAWLGHLTAARSDLRGAGTIESLVNDLDLDALTAEHDAVAAGLLDIWLGDAPVNEKFHAGCTMLPSCFLSERLPFDLVLRLRRWHDQREELAAAGTPLSDESLETFELVENYASMNAEGVARYAIVWRDGVAPAPAPSEGAAGSGALAAAPAPSAAVGGGSTGGGGAGGGGGGGASPTVWIVAAGIAILVVMGLIIAQRPLPQK